jgi:cadmium resistance protein CadD (predicted permease)
MNSLILIVPVAAGAFVATNLDNFALLVTFLVRYRHRTLVVAAAYVASISLLGLVGYGIGRGADIAPVELLGWLGLIPIALGTAGVVRLFRDKTAAGTLREDSVGGSGTAFLATLTSQIGNGADTIATFGALFADSNPASDTLIIFTFAAMAIIFLASAHYAIRHPAVKNSVENHAHRITPFILIIVGAYILANTATDLLPG